MAQGLNLIYGVMRVVNLAHGDLIVIGGLIAFSLFHTTGLSPLFALFPVFALLFGIGLAIGAGLLERIPEEGPRGELRTLLATFGLSYLLANTSFLIWGGQFQSIPFLQGAILLGPLTVPAGLAAASFAAFGLALLLHLFLERTLIGKTIRAVAQSPLGAAATGIGVRRVRVLTFALGSALAGAAGVLVICLVPFQSASGPDLTVQSFTLIALGGLGNVLGAWVAAELLGMIEVFAQYTLGPDAATAVFYLLFILLLILRPQGLLGQAGRL
jgi:branched-chain amino acid transport system permease protein